MINANEAGAKFTKKSFMSFLEAQPNCDEKWVAGIIRSSTPEDIDKAIESLSAYKGSDRFEVLKKLCGKSK